MGNMKVYDPRVMNRGIMKERKEHPELPLREVKMLVRDHLELYGGRAYPKGKK